MNIYILERHKDTNGVVIDYKVKIDGNVTNLPFSVLKDSFNSSVRNAYLVGNDYRAKNGFHIKTVVETTNLRVHKPQATGLSFPNTSPLTQDFYGKEFINICRRIRQYARVGNLRVNTNVHKSNNGNNVQLFDIIKLCGLSVQEFVMGYLSVLQPYCLEYFQRKKAEQINQVWMVEMGYSIRMIIKLDERDRNKPMIISFHESIIERNGKYSHQSGVKDFSDKPCAVLIEGANNIAGAYSVNAYIQTGFIRYSLTDTAIALYKDVALINYSSIERNVNNILDNMFNKLASVYASSGVPTFNNLNNIVSFSGRGYAVINQLILIIDLYSAYSDANSIKVLVEMMQNIVAELKKSEKKSVLNALVSKFGRAPKNRLAGLVYEELS